MLVKSRPMSEPRTVLAKPRIMITQPRTMVVKPRIKLANAVTMLAIDWLICLL